MSLPYPCTLLGCIYVVSGFLGSEECCSVRVARYFFFDTTHFSYRKGKNKLIFLNKENFVFLYANSHRTNEFMGRLKILVPSLVSNKHLPCSDVNLFHLITMGGTRLGQGRYDPSRNFENLLMSRYICTLFYIGHHRNFFFFFS